MTTTVETLGDFSIIKELEEGFFGTVYLAEHRFMKTQFILKVLPEKLSNNPEFIERFERNIGTIVKLDHPSIIKIHNVSASYRKYFLVMDPVDLDENTMSLESYLLSRQGKLEEKEIEIILSQVASALDYAHQIPFNDQYLFHGGIKLTNILVKKENKDLKVYLTDFGLNRFIGEETFFTKLVKTMKEAVSDPFTKEKALRKYFSSLFFLAPEQKEISLRNQWDAKVDSYAFGVLAYHLLTCKYPEGVFELPSSVRADFTGQWDELIQSLLMQDPNKRPLHLQKVMEKYLSVKNHEKPLENKMQLSFAFPEKEKPISLPENSAELKPVINPQEIERPVYEPDPGAIFQKEMQVSRYEPKKVEIKEVEPILNEMVVISGGTYDRGCQNGARDEMPRHPITVNSFALDIHPVTNEQFVRFLQAMGGEKDGNNNDIIRLKDSRIKKSAGKLMIESGYTKHPVVGVTWYGAIAYAKWVGKRLPTEAEWEIAASGGKDSIYPTGDEIERAQANFFSFDTTSVMSYPPNEFGLYDMAGNVYEWCQDWYAYNYYDTSLQEPENPLGPPQGVYRVLRGGCWKSLKEDLRISHRHRNNPGTVNGTYGFRCAADVS